MYYVLSTDIQNENDVSVVIQKFNKHQQRAEIYVCCNAKIGTRNHNQSIAQFICDAKIS